MIFMIYIFIAIIITKYIYITYNNIFTILPYQLYENIFISNVKFFDNNDDDKNINHNHHKNDNMRAFETRQ